MATSFFPSWTEKNTGEVGVTTIKCNFSAGKKTNIIMPPIPFLHIPITFCQIEYGFNIKRLHEFFKWDIKVNISSRGYFNLGTYMIGALGSDGPVCRLGCGFATKWTCWKSQKASDVRNDRKHFRKYKNAQNDSLLKGQQVKWNLMFRSQIQQSLWQQTIYP